MLSATLKQKAQTHTQTDTSKKLNVFLHAYTNEHRMIPMCVHDKGKKT